jgi:predicted ATP-dependent serine protease
LRLKEAAKLGFEQAFAPPQKKNGGAGVKVRPIAHIADLAAALGATGEA